MALIVNAYGDNPQQPGIWAETYVPDQLIAGNLKLVTQPIRIANGATYPRGTVLGRITDFSIDAVAETATGAANTGNGTIGSLSAGVGVLLGSYVLTATSATEFDVTDPEGNALARRRRHAVHGRGNRASPSPQARPLSSQETASMST